MTKADSTREKFHRLAKAVQFFIEDFGGDEFFMARLAEKIDACMYNVQELRIAKQEALISQLQEQKK